MLATTAGMAARGDGDDRPPASLVAFAHKHGTNSVAAEAAGAAGRIENSASRAGNAPGAATWLQVQVLVRCADSRTRYLAAVAA